MDDIYNNSVYLSHNPQWHQEDAPGKADFIFKILESEKINFQSVCEIGCGSGEILKQLQLKIADPNMIYHGYDISSEAISLSKSKVNSTLDFFCEDFTQKAISTPYDVLLVIDVIEHLRDYFTFIEKIKPKGRYTVFHIPLDMFVWSLFREKMLLESKTRVGHIHNFTEHFILSVLKDAGYTIMKTQFTEPDYTANSVKQRIVNFARRVLFKVSPRFCTKTLGGYSILVLCRN